MLLGGTIVSVLLNGSGALDDMTIRSSEGRSIAKQWTEACAVTQRRIKHRWHMTWQDTPRYLLGLADPILGDRRIIYVGARHEFEWQGPANLIQFALELDIEQ